MCVCVCVCACVCVCVCGYNVGVQSKVRIVHDPSHPVQQPIGREYRVIPGTGFMVYMQPGRCICTPYLWVPCVTFLPLTWCSGAGINHIFFFFVFPSLTHSPLSPDLTSTTKPKPYMVGTDQDTHARYFRAYSHSFPKHILHTDGSL